MKKALLILVLLVSI